MCGANRGIDPCTRWQISNQQHDVFGLRSCPDNGMNTPVPAIAGTESFLEKVLLVAETGVLVERTEVPEHPDVLDAKLAHQRKPMLDDGGHDPEVKALGIRMTSRTTSKVSCGRVSRRHTHAKARKHTREIGFGMFCNLFEDEIVAS